MRPFRGHAVLIILLAAPSLAVACRTGGRATPEREVAFVVVPATPAERAAHVAALTLCAPIAPAPASWSTVPVTALPGAIRLPPRLAASPAEVPTSAEQSWADTALGEVTFQREDEAGLSSGFTITPEFEPGTIFVVEGTCAQRFDGRLSALRRSFWVQSRRGGDTVFVATTDIPLGGDLQLGAGVTSRSRAGRESLLSALASLRLRVP
jgi:hypothetical protein